MANTNIGFEHFKNSSKDKELQDIQNQLYHLSHFINHDTIGNIDAVKEELTKKEYELKKKNG
ncbi:MAG TPA: hypothetical protein DCR12_00860 [Lachnospiraceae bacterium]|nr:hypothetical protein [Lachnospiraceae bacterium]